MGPVPTRTLAGVKIPDTPLIAKALALCREHVSELVYNHSVRSMLFGFIIADKTPGLQNRDREAHAVSALLHDLGWDETGKLVTDDKRFEVDGANAARVFLKKETSDWDKHRLQLVWDAIALHTTTSIACHKEPEVQATAYGINADFSGPDHAVGGHLTWDQWNAIVKELPRLGFRQGVIDACCKLCREKPQTTYDNAVGHFGERYVEGYSWKGKLAIDMIEQTLD